MAAYDGENTDLLVYFDSEGTEIHLAVDSEGCSVIVQPDDVHAIVSDLLNAFTIRGGNVAQLLARLIDEREAFDALADVMERGDF